MVDILYSIILLCSVTGWLLILSGTGRLETCPGSPHPHWFSWRVSSLPVRPLSWEPGQVCSADGGAGVGYKGAAGPPFTPACAHLSRRL